MSDELFSPSNLKPPDPTGKTCEFCGAPATIGYALFKPIPKDPDHQVDTGMRVYACDADAHRAREMTALPMGKAGGVLGGKAAA